ncbi:hypothetical protein IJU97_03445 [bacterium]|nr:hypothetical protein [bacterium]
MAASTGNGESIKISSDEATIVKLLVLEDDSLDNRQKRELMASINRRIDVEEVARGVQEKIDSEFSDILSPAERESLQATLSDLLLGAMKEQPTNVDVNGL